MTVLYFIQSHKNPSQIYRLIAKLEQSPDALILLSHDFSSCDLDLKQLARFPKVKLIKRNRSARRGDDSVLQIYLDAVNWVYEHDYNFDWFVCLSGQDYPIRPIAEIEAFLARTEYDGLIRHWEILSDDSLLGKAAGHKRFFARYITLPQWSKWWLRKMCYVEPFIPALKVQWRFAAIGLEARATPFNDQFKCYGGWYWNTLSKKCLDYLRNYLQEHPQVWQYYRQTLAPEESLPATVLVNSKQFNLCNDSLRYLKFPASLGGYARSLTVADYPELVRSQAHFARKLDLESDSEIFDLLDKLIDSRANRTTGSIANITNAKEC